MHNAGLRDWIAVNEEEYIAKAVSFSTNLVNLEKLRNSFLRAGTCITVVRYAAFCPQFRGGTVGNVANLVW